MHAGLEGFTMPSDEAVHRAAASMRLLGDPTRIKVLCALLQGESSVTCLAELVEASPSAVSQHLAKLRLAGLVRPRRDGAFVYYVAADDSVGRLLAEALGEVPTSGPKHPAPLPGPKHPAHQIQPTAP